MTIPQSTPRCGEHVHSLFRIRPVKTSTVRYSDFPPKTPQKREKKTQIVPSPFIEKSPIAMASTTSQLSCFSAINRHHSHSRFFLSPTLLRPQLWINTNVERGLGSISKTNLSLGFNEGKLHVERAENSSYPDVEGGGEEEESGVGNLGTSEQKRAAKIHDFCFGIPFGGIVLSGGLLGFVFSRNPATLTTGVLYGGALLALSTFSLKIWRQGKSSLPFILGQGALSAALLWKNFQTFSLTKKVFPTGLYAFISAAMLFFYSYVLLSGGNPPPKKLKSSPTPSVAS